MRRSQLTHKAFDLLNPIRRKRCLGGVLLAICCAGVMMNCRLSQAADRFAADSSQPASVNTVVSDPYLVFVVEQSAHLRCGPAGEYYRTDPLRHGQELEVYVETEDGWLGVRPSEESFCWIPADATRLLPAATSAGVKADALEAEVIEDKTVAWIGTNLGRARRYRWQVQLGKGETVTILGRSERDGPDGPQTWYRIVPPSGEFRWIHRDQVVTTAEELLASVKGQNGNAQSDAEESIDFLPAGPSYAPAQTARAGRETEKLHRNSPGLAVGSPVMGSSVIGSSATSNGGLRRVSDDQPYREGGPAESAEDRANALAEIRRLDEIERNIEARDRSRLARAGDLATDPLTQDAQPRSEVASPEQDITSHAATDAHQMRSFSQRVTDGLSTLIGGGRPVVEGLQPATQSSRRQPELVPVGSGLATAPIAAAPIAAAPSDPVSVPTAAVSFGGQANDPPPAKMVPATEYPGFRSGESQIAISSAPRVVSQQSGASPTGLHASSWMASSSFPTHHDALPPTKLRTITAEQLRDVQRSVAEATAESLPMVMSSLMARGASAPEIRMVADAAQAFELNNLAQRARDYESLARRRDGDTVVAASPFPPTHSVQASVFQTREIEATPPQPSGPILPATYTDGGPSPADGTGEQTGVLVEVYSADPNRPPFAITDRAGQTVAYITPAPGVELRNHLGSQVRVRGESGFLQGLDTPHVLATAAERVIR